MVFLDEVDALQDSVLISVLRQLQEGYRNRPLGFPWSMAPIGLRDIRDYRADPGIAGRRGTPSPFNIIVRSITLRSFTEEEVAELYQQHTDATGQGFEAAAVARAFELTQGPPWLVNALTKLLVEELVPDVAQVLTAADVERAKEVLIARRDTHIDSLTGRLREPRIRAVLEPMLAGELLGDVPEDDRRFAVDLGLVRLTQQGGLDVANPIYREVIARALASGTRDSLPQIAPTWLRGDGRLDRERLLEAFLGFWRRHGEPLLQTAPYHEIAPHLVLMVFLDRVANGGGTLERGRMDLCLRYGPDIMGFELKVWRDGRPDPLAEGLQQLDGYLAGLGVEQGWLVIFDQRSGLPPVEQRTVADRATTPAGREVVVIRG